MTVLPVDHPERLLRFRGSGRLWESQIELRQKVIDRIDYQDGRWIWTGQAKSAKGQKYPQLSIGLGAGVRYLANARHVVFYLAHGWVDSKAQQYRVRDGDPLNVHPENLVPVPPITTSRKSSSLWGVKELRKHFG